MIQNEKAYNEHKSETKQRRPVNRGVWKLFFTCLYMITFQANFKLSFRPDSVPTPSAIIVTQALPHYGEEINLESQYVTLAAFIKNYIILAGLWP